MNPAHIEAMKSAAELGATHYQICETFHAGRWSLASLSFICPSEPCDIPDSRYELAVWTAATGTLVAGRRPTIYWKGYNLIRANREHLYVSAPLPIPSVLLPPPKPVARVFSAAERRAMLAAAALGATHYQLLEHYYDWAWHLGAIAFSGTEAPAKEGQSEPRRRILAEWSAEMDKMVRCDTLAYRVDGHNADKSDEAETAISAATPLPVDQLREEALRQHVREFIEMELTSKLEEQITKAVNSGVLDLSGWDGVLLRIPRALATAILREAADRVIWERSHGKQAARTINNIRNVL